MKTYKNLLFTFLILSSGSIYSQWYEVSAPINDICQTNNGNIYAVGGGGSIRKSVNSGANWQLLDSKIIDDLYSVCFVNDNVGFSSGEKGMIKTTDGGITWSIVNSIPSNRRYHSISFISETIGYVINDIGHIFKTTDGGSTWNAVSFSFSITASTYQYFNQVLFIDESVGYVCNTNNTDNYGNVYRTINGGATWTQISTGRFVDFMNSTRGYQIKSANIISRTFDAGTTWSDYNIGVNDYFTKIKFLNNGIGFALGYNGSILKTYDEGITWIYQQSHVPVGLGSIIFDNSSNNCIAVGANATILKTTNGGGNWSLRSLSPPSDSYVNCGSFGNDTTAFVIGNGYVTKTTDGGVTWKPVSLISNDILNDIIFVNKDIGLVAGNNGKIWKTTDGGNTWSLKPSGTSENIYKIFKLNQNDLFFLSGMNTTYNCYQQLFKSSDGGETWSNLNLYGATSLAFYNDTSGILVNKFNNELYRTTNKGNSWSMWKYPNCNPCVSEGLATLINFSESTLYVGGKYLWRSIDYGQTWSQIDYQNVQPFTYYDPPIALHFTDSVNGYVLFPWGDFRKSNDGGNSFSPESYRGYGYNYSPSSFAFSNKNGIAFGNKGAIHKSFKIDGGFLVGIPNIEKKRNSSLTIYPNPSNGIFKLKSSVKLENSFLEIFNDIGTLVYKKAIDNCFNESVDVSHLASGIYTIRVGKETGKVIISK